MTDEELERCLSDLARVKVKPLWVVWYERMRAAGKQAKYAHSIIEEKLGLKAGAIKKRLRRSQEK